MLDDTFPLSVGTIRSQTEPSSRSLIDATGEIIDPVNNFVWTADAVTRTFRGAIGSGYLPNCEIVEFAWIKPGPTYCAVIRDTATGLLWLYKMNRNGRPKAVTDLPPDWKQAFAIGQGATLSGSPAEQLLTDE